MREPLVSIIIPTYRRPALLSRAIASVLAQTYTRWEILVVDDNDADSVARRETEAFMQRHANEPRIRHLTHARNKGLPAARNTGILASSGLLVAFLDDDDAWLPEKLGRQVALFRAAEDLVLVYTGLRFVDTHGRLIRTKRADPQGLSRDRLLEENWIGTPSSVMCRRSALVDIGLFDERMRSLEDWDLYLRLDGQFGLVDEPLSIYYLHNTGRMMDNDETLVRASEVIYRKNRHELLKKPASHAAFLRRYARVHLHAGHRGLARRFLRQSLALRPLDRKTLRHLLELELGEDGVESLRQATMRLRARFSRAGTSSGL